MAPNNTAVPMLPSPGATSIAYCCPATAVNLTANMPGYDQHEASMTVAPAGTSNNACPPPDRIAALRFSGPGQAAMSATFSVPRRMVAGQPA